MTAKIAHRWGAVFVAACGARNIQIAPTESLVTCPDCKAIPEDPAAWAERDQFVAAIRETHAPTGDAR